MFEDEWVFEVLRDYGACDADEGVDEQEVRLQEEFDEYERDDDFAFEDDQ